MAFFPLVSTEQTAYITPPVLLAAFSRALSPILVQDRETQFPNSTMADGPATAAAAAITSKKSDGVGAMGLQVDAVLQDLDAQFTLNKDKLLEMTRHFSTLYNYGLGTTGAEMPMIPSFGASAELGFIVKINLLTNFSGYDGSHWTSKWD